MQDLKKKVSEWEIRMRKDDEELTSHTIQQLTSKGLDVRPWEGRKVVFFQKVVDTFSKEFCDNTDMVPMIKVLQKMDAFAGRIVRFWS